MVPTHKSNFAKCRVSLPFALIGRVGKIFAHQKLYLSYSKTTFSFKFRHLAGKTLLIYASLSAAAFATSLKL